MGKRTASEINYFEPDSAMLDGYADKLQPTILSKIATNTGKAEACALLSALDPRSTIVRTNFLTPEFCTAQMYPCLLSEDLMTVLECANTIKTWLHTASDDPEVEVIRRMYALQLMPSLLQSIEKSTSLLDRYVEMSEQGRKQVDEALESLLASVMILGESLEVAMEQINRIPCTIRLITKVYEKRAFLPEALINVAAECLSVLTEDNEGFAASADGIRLYTLLLALPADWSFSQALPYTIKSIMAISALHGSAEDQVYERCLDRLCSILASPVAPSADVLSTTLETLANVMEGLDQSCLAVEDYNLIMRMLELVCKVMVGEQIEDIVMSRGLGALVNLLILAAEHSGQNVNLMIWNEAVSSWLPKCTSDEEMISSLISALRLLLLALPNSPSISPSQLQMLVSAVKTYPSVYEASLFVLIPLVKADAMPSGMETIISELLPELHKADPEDLEDLGKLLDAHHGASIQPLLIRLQSLFIPETTTQQ